MDISVIVAVRNGARTLRQCIESVLAQQACDLEVIVIDALSTDATLEIIASFDDPRVRSIREMDDGIYDAWNKALGVARGEWCAFLGSDDYYVSPSSLSALLATAAAAPSCTSLVYGGVQRHPDGEVLFQYRHAERLLSWLLRGQMVPHQGVLHLTTALRSIGGFDATYRIAGDRDACIRLMQRGRARRCDVVVAAMRRGGVSTSPSHRLLHHQERRRVLRAHRGVTVSTIRFLMWRLRARLRRVVGERASVRLEHVHSRLRTLAPRWSRRS
jgi:GT2 family glycosyltransferase